MDDAFIKQRGGDVGNSQWKKALERFEKYCKAVRYVSKKTPSRTKGVGEMLSSFYSVEKAVNTKMLLINNVQYLGRQVLALRSHYKLAKGTGAKVELNFYKLLNVRAEAIDGPQKIDDEKRRQIHQPRHKK